MKLCEIQGRIHNWDVEYMECATGSTLSTLRIVELLCKTLVIDGGKFAWQGFSFRVGPVLVTDESDLKRYLEGEAREKIESAEKPGAVALVMMEE